MSLWHQRKPCTLCTSSWPGHRNPVWGILPLPQRAPLLPPVSSLAKTSVPLAFLFPSVPLDAVLPWFLSEGETGLWVSGNRVLLSCSSEHFSLPREGLSFCPSCPTADHAGWSASPAPTTRSRPCLSQASPSHDGNPWGTRPGSVRKRGPCSICSGRQEKEGGWVGGRIGCGF